MKCPSLYNFYRTYFDIPSSGKLQFALAIRETETMLSEIMENKLADGVERYNARPYARQLTNKFLINFYRLAEHHYHDMFAVMERRPNHIRMPKQQLGTRVDLNIPFAPCYVENERRLIFFEYGKLDSVAHWQTVFKTLIAHFDLSEPLPPADMITY